MTTIFERNWTTRRGAPKRAYRVTFTASGRKKFRQFARRKDAQAFVERLGVERPKIEAQQTSSPTVAALARAWLDACRRGRDGRAPLEKHTVANYETHIERYIGPRFGTVPVHRLTKSDFRRFREELDTEGLARSTVKKILGCFKAIVQHAVDLDHLEAHPGRAVTVRHAARHAKLIEVPSPDEVRSLLRAARDFSLHPDQRVANAWAIYYPFLMLLIGTGIRLSEARGLRRRDVGHDRITIRQRADRSGEIGAPKSVSGIRTIFIAKELQEALALVLSSHNHDLVFPSRTGRPIDPQNVMKRMWRPLCEATGTTGYGMHSLRHHFASRLIASGMSVKEVSTALGHADEAFTLRTYGHLFHDEDSVKKRKAAAEAVLA